MRKITQNIYKYDELPTEEAKEKARDWWIEGEIQDPAFKAEHLKSMESAIELFESDKPIGEIIQESEYCKMTGYYADSFLADCIDENYPYQNTRGVDADVIKSYYEDKWNKELEDRLKDVKYIEENILANEYEFFEDGSIF